ncbi:unnamed protein product [Clonostachys rosea]|uniref:SMP-LTD domain-containing protein n=1 Tax=Bionectria ochroleuca TaxID=29856 RepID=A0ABY6U4K8_BIOOC|nr:unnamed protein product [Clonostachys rosea]
MDLLQPVEITFSDLRGGAIVNTLQGALEYPATIRARVAKIAGDIPFLLEEAEMPRPPERVLSKLPKLDIDTKGG